MERRRSAGLTVACAVMLATFVACGLVPHTERSQLRLVSDSEERALGEQAYREILADARIVRGTPEAEMVERVGRRLAAVTGEAYAWEFALLAEDETVNAFCLPGGKIAVYTGLLPVTQNEDALAAVLGHEIAHATAHHGAERLSHQMLSEGALAVVEAGLGGVEAAQRDAILGALGLGAQVGVHLPYSREHEYEADALGLRYVIRAGYNPHEAVRLWQRMARLGGERPPALLSTHPEPLARAERIALLIPKLLAEEGVHPPGVDAAPTGRAGAAGRER